MNAALPFAVPPEALGLGVSLGIGLLIGIERERSKGEGPGRGAAGVRTFLLIALAGALAHWFGGVGLAVGGGFVALAALAAYRRSAASDPGLTSEVAMLVVFLLGALAMRATQWAAALGVVVALVLASKHRLHAFTRKTLTERELHDALLLAAAAVVVLPLLPDTAIDPWGALNPRRLWMLVVLVMAINAAGYVGLRLLGARAGLALAGLLGGFVSSTATIAAMGDRSRATPALLRHCTAAALFSNIATVAMIAVVCGALSMPLLHALRWPLALAGTAALLAAALAHWRALRAAPAAEALGDSEALGRPFEPRHALAFAAVVSAVLLLCAALHAWLGQRALLAAAAISGFADVHAAAASLAHLIAGGALGVEEAGWPLCAALASNCVAKLLMARLRGGAQFALRLLPGVAALLAAFALGLWLGG